MAINKNLPAYKRLRTIYAERRRPLVFWVGAGLSQPLLPTWVGLRRQLIAEATETLTALERAEAERREDILTSASSTDNLWQAFDLIKEVMGRADFNASVRSIFEPADSLAVPPIYDQLWSLQGVTGVVTLNIDGFVKRSHSQIRPGEAAADFVGRDAADYAHIVGSHKPFIANLHGIHQAATSWVFTESDIRRLLSKPEYVQVINFLFSATTVVFLGISADDVAAGGVLANLTTSGLDLGQHFWITDRNDAKTDRWSQAAGLQLIRYEATSGEEHEQSLSEILEDLKSFVSHDTKPAVVVPGISSVDKMPSKAILKLMDDNTLRETLGGYAKNLISSGMGTTDTNEYRRFLADNSRELHMAWHITDKQPNNLFFDYEILSRISSGPFSSVWQVTDQSDGALYALKVVQIDNMDKGVEIDSFRRGVESLTYLSKADVPGTAKIKDAYEIPTAVVMEFVDGDDLQSIVATKRLEFWADGLSIISNVCEHLDYAHNLPQGVLHRDIRPSNIMVPYYYWTADSADAAGHSRSETRILNYDLSWHSNAQGKSMAGNLNEAGYYAPEQLLDISGPKARSTLVDSYGLGMTLFYTYTRSAPPPGGSSSIEWAEILRAKFKPDKSLPWLSATARLKRLVEEATRPEVNARLTMSQIVGQLRSLEHMMSRTLPKITPDIWAEELMAQVVQSEYEVDIIRNIYRKELRTGRTFEICGDLSQNKVTVKFRNMGIDSTDWKEAGKRWKPKLESAKEILVSGGWTISPNTRMAHMDILLEAEAPTAALVSNFPRVTKTLSDAITKVRLD